MGVKIKHTDPTLNSFSTDDIVVNVQSGSLFFKSNTKLYKLQGDDQSTTNIIEFSGLSEIVQDTSNNIGMGTNPSTYNSTDKLTILSSNAPDATGGTIQIITGTGTGGTGSRLKLGGTTTYSFIQSHVSQKLAINPLGNNVGIGKTNPSSKLDVNGTITATGTNFASDINLKTNINNIETPLETISKLKGITFDWKDHIIETDKTLQGTKHGLIAQEVEKILPNLVHTNKTKSVSYIEIIPILIEAIKEQQNQIDELKNKINE
jgi:hypothetical protein